MPYPMKKKESDMKLPLKKIDKEDVMTFFELDIDNCKLKKKDFCEVIASFINDPISTSKLYREEINLYFETRRNL
jgi:hypothetical protein